MDDQAIARQYARDLFSGGDSPRLSLTLPSPAPTLEVAQEGDNPGPGPISDDAHARDFAHRLFDPTYAAYQQPLPEE